MNKPSRFNIEQRARELRREEMARLTLVVLSAMTAMSHKTIDAMIAAIKAAHNHTRASANQRNTMGNMGQEHQAR